MLGLSATWHLEILLNTPVNTITKQIYLSALRIDERKFIPVVQNFLRKFKVNKCKTFLLLVYKMKIMQLVVYVSPKGVIIAKCDVAPIQSNF